MLNKTVINIFLSLYCIIRKCKVTRQNFATIISVKFQTIWLYNFCAVICGQTDRQTRRAEQMMNSYVFT